MITYQDAGVDIAKADVLVERIKEKVKSTYGSRVIAGVGGFASLYEIGQEKILAAGADGVGTKLELAKWLNKHDTIGIDLVAMCINDLIVQGARPLFFLDYISTQKIKLNKMKSIIKGIIKGCKISDCMLVGGETAEMPGTYSSNKFDLAGFAVGVVSKKKLIHKGKVKNKDVIMAIPSNGLHSNGFSLVRHVLKKQKINIFLKKELLKPTKIYAKSILKLSEKKLLHSSANITGGGIVDNIIRSIPNQHTANIDLSKIKVGKIFKWLKSKNISDKEMLKTFNCGVGFCIIVKREKISQVKKFFDKNFKPYEIGYISKSTKKIKLINKLKW